MKREDLLYKVRSAIAFICKPLALPERVVTEAAEAAVNVILLFYKGTLGA